MMWHEKGKYKNICKGRLSDRVFQEGPGAVWTTSESAGRRSSTGAKIKGINGLGRSMNTWDHKVNMLTSNSLHC